MKYLLIILTSIVSLSSSAQETGAIKHGMQIGFTLNEFQNDFGVGIEITSPFVAYGSVAARFRANLMFYQHLFEDEYTWSPYANYTLGLIGVGKEVGDFMRLYGEGGISVIQPSTQFSDIKTEFGGYGLFGFEFFLMPSLAYKIEIGGIGMGAKANLIEGNPIYSNGFMMTTGLRLQF